MKIQKKIIFFFFFFWGGGLGRGLGRVGGVRVDVNGEVKFFVIIQKKKIGGFGGRVGVGFRFRGVRVDVFGEVKFL